MALITISGYPCSGKSTRALQLKEDFESRIQQALNGAISKLQVVIVDDKECGVRREAYDNSIAEKPARASLFSHVTRELGQNKIVICDSANYIKGFRYQMHCAAREAKVRLATVFVAAPPSQCEKWHSERPLEDQYKPETFENMIMRYEEPSSMVRWDSPLFTIAWDDVKIPTDEIWAAITTGEKKAPTAAVAVNAKAPPNSLQILTTTTSAVISTLQSSISMNPSSSTLVIPASAPFTRTITIKAPPGRILTLSELQRLKRQFETQQRKAISTNAPSSMPGGWTEQAVGEAFGRFLEETWGTRS